MLSTPFPLADYTNIDVKTPFRMYNRLPHDARKTMRIGRHMAEAGGVGASIGMAVGSVLAAQSENDPVVGATIGGVAGGAIGSVGALAMHKPGTTLEIIGAPAYALGSGIVKAVKGGTTLNALESIGAGGVALGNAALKGAITGAEIGVGALAKAGIRATSFASHFLKPDANEMIGYKLNAGGKMLVTAGALTKGIVGGFSTFNKIHQGTIEPGLVRATPQPVYSSMMNNAGATGDLVFALHNNRRG